jgi:extracellular factor (EF) 3-hydroxypalmitic acid methyl ester biosynthesis protein
LNNPAKFRSPSVTEPQEPKTTLFAYRGERIIIPESLECHAEIKATNGDKWILKVRDVSSFGIRLTNRNKDTAFVLNELVTVTIFIHEQQIFEAAASVANETTQGDEVSYGLSLISSFIDMEQIRAVISNNGSRAALQVGTSLLPLLTQVRREFKALVADLHSVFQEIKSRLNDEQTRISASSLNENHAARMTENALALSVSLNSQTILELFKQFQDIVSTFNGEENSLHKKYFRVNFGETIQRTPFLKRALEKPLGYPGDYGLMVMFYQYKDMGETIFDRFMHRLSCSQPVAVANQNRVEFLADTIESYYSSKPRAEFKISSVACGPAQELRLFLERSRIEKTGRIDVILVDQESNALDYAIDSLKTAGNNACDFRLKTYKEDAVLGILKQRLFSEQLNNSDVIVCAGLFDYLSDRVASKLTETLVAKLAPGGKLLIGNVSTDHPNKFSMEYFMEWNLVLRSPKQLLDLVPARIREQAEYTASVKSESLGINLFLEVRRTD